MPRLTDIYDPFLNKSYEEQLEHIRRIREGRVVKAERSKTKTAKRKAKKEQKLKEMFDSLPEDMQADIINKISGGGK